jgi:tRNA threonylcarbamoyl adenosine modification protein YeaZ
MNWVLGIDTSSTELSIGLLHEGSPFLTCTRYVRNSHAEHITNAVKFVLSSSGIVTADLSAVGIAVGPGSFTGLRIGISFLKGLLLKRDTPVVPVSSLQSLAEAYENNTGTLVAAIDARQGNVFCAAFRKDRLQLTRLTDDMILSAAEFREKHSSCNVILYDTLGRRTGADVEQFNDLGAIVHVHNISLQRGLACARYAACTSATSVWTNASEVQPNYMQDSYAKPKHHPSVRL